LRNIQFTERLIVVVGLMIYFYALIMLCNKMCHSFNFNLTKRLRIIYSRIVLILTFLYQSRLQLQPLNLI